MGTIQHHCYLHQERLINQEEGISKKPRILPSLALADVSVCEITIRRTLNNRGARGSVARRKPLLPKKAAAGSVRIERDQVAKPENFWKRILWMDETKIELLGLNKMLMFWGKANPAFQHKDLITCETWQNHGLVLLC